MELTTKEICKRIEFPQNAIDTLSEYERFVNGNDRLKEAFCEQIKLYTAENSKELYEYLKEIDRLAGRYSLNTYILQLLFILRLSPFTLEKYIEKGLSPELFFEGLKDLKYKLYECLECKNVPGTFVGFWYDGFLRVDRFTLGRFQYEPNRVYTGEDIFFGCGYVLKNGTKIVDFHIPSSGEPLTDEVRNKSYKMAYDFFSDQIKDGILVLHTHSWLVFENNRKFLPENSNIRRFMDDFKIVNSKESVGHFGDLWRIFGADADLPTEKLPENTSLRRAMKKWLLDGNKCGTADGYIVLKNGTNITNRTV